MTPDQMTSGTSMRRGTWLLAALVSFFLVSGVALVQDRTMYVLGIEIFS